LNSPYIRCGDDRSPCPIFENDRAAFAAAGSVPIHAWDRVNARAETRNVRLLAGSRRCQVTAITAHDRGYAQFGAMALSEGLSEDEVQTYQRRKGGLQEQIQHLDVQIDELKQQRKQTDHHIPVKSLPEEERFTRLSPSASTSSIRSK